MKMSVPKIETIGYLVADVQDSPHNWFELRGMYFYCLISIKFYLDGLILLMNEQVQTFPIN